MTGSRKSESVADRMLAVAVGQIAAEGMRVKLDQIRMEDVIKQAGVSRATAYRRWPTRDDFLADVLVATVQQTSLIPESHDEIVALRELVAAHRDGFASAQSRRDLIVEALRVSIDADIRRVLASPRWTTFQALFATLPSLPPGRVRGAVQTALRDAEQEFSARRGDIYADLAGLLGYRIRPETGADFQTLGAAAGALMTGVVLRARADPGWLDARHEAALFGASMTAAWSEPERLLTGLLLSYLQPDPGTRWTAATVAERLRAFEELATALLAGPGRKTSEPGSSASA